MNLAERTRAALDATQAQVVVMARAGPDLSRHGLDYSHLGPAYRDDNGWRVVHKTQAVRHRHRRSVAPGLG